MTKKSSLAWAMAAMLHLGIAVAEDTEAQPAQPAAAKPSDQSSAPKEASATPPSTPAPAAEEPNCD
jgi:hypothetical protein